MIDEVEALRQSDIERAAYQPEPVAGMENHSLIHICMYEHVRVQCTCALLCTLCTLTPLECTWYASEQAYSDIIYKCTCTYSLLTNRQCTCIA